MKRIGVILSVFCAVLTSLSAQSFQKSQSEDFDDIMQGLMQFSNLPSDELLIETAKCFLGTPYVAGTLEGSPEELKVDIRKTDCILFVEQCIAITYLLKNAEGGDVPTFGDFTGKVRDMRYRNGVVEGYASRLHYTSEWILQNESAGLFEEITKELGGMALDQQFSFMSGHTDSYAALKGNPGEVERIRSVEESLNGATGYFHIPASEIPDTENEIRDGDIIFFTSKVKGLDITHVAIAYEIYDKEDDTRSLHFIHASSRAGKVIVEPKTLADYTKTGIRVARLSF